jgi:hypothetical protein
MRELAAFSPIFCAATARFTSWELLALLMLLVQPNRKRRPKRPYMKTLHHIPLRYCHSLRASFTLPIQKKAIQPQMLPFSSKKLKGMRHDFERGSHRFH